MIWILLAFAYGFGMGAFQAVNMEDGMSYPKALLDSFVWPFFLVRNAYHYYIKKDWQ